MDMTNDSVAKEKTLIPLYGVSVVIPPDRKLAFFSHYLTMA